MKGAIGNAFILNMVITFIIIFFMLLIGSVAYSKAYKTNKFLMDSLVDYVEYFNSVSYVDGDDGKTKYLNQKDLCFNCTKHKVYLDWRSKVNDYLSKSGYVLSSNGGSCPKKYDEDLRAYVHPSGDGYIIKKDTEIGEYEYCIYQKRYYELSAGDDKFTKQRFSYKVVSYMKFDFPIIGEFIKLPITSESKVILNFH